MFLDYARDVQVSQPFQREGTFAATRSNPTRRDPDNRLMIDCRALSRQVKDLFTAIEVAADDQEGEHRGQQALLREAGEQVVKLMERVTVTPASTLKGVQGKHSVADVLLATDWYDEPSPCRDALLLSFVRDAARLRYPAVPAADPCTVRDQEATDAVIARSRACLGIIAELAANFGLKDRNSELGQADPDNLDATILALSEQKKVAVEALVRLPALCAASIHAKRVVLRRMLEAGDSDAHHLRVRLARSFCGDLNTFNRANTHGHAPSSAYTSIWNTLSAKFRRLAVSQHR